MVLGETLLPRAMSAAMAHMRPLDGSITAPSIVVAVSVSSSCVFIVPDFLCRFLGIGRWCGLHLRPSCSDNFDCPGWFGHSIPIIIVHVLARNKTLTSYPHINFLFVRPLELDPFVGAVVLHVIKF